jgi:hypothetical protein
MKSNTEMELMRWGMLEAVTKGDHLVIVAVLEDVRIK